MARIRLVQELVDVCLSAGVIIESEGPITDEMQEWLESGEAELIESPLPPEPPPS